MNYELPSITSLIFTSFTDVHKELWPIYSALVFLFYIINITWKKIESVVFERKFSLIQAIFEASLVVILTAFIGVLMMGILWFFNSFADLVFKTDGMIDFVLRITGLKKDNLEFSWMDFSVYDLVSAFAGLAVFVSFYVVGIFRFMILSIDYILFPLHAAKALIPLYGIKSLAPIIKDIISVSSWSLYLSVVSKIITLLSENGYDTASFTGLLEYIVLMCSFFVMVQYIPKKASADFGGSDFSMLTAMSAGYSKIVALKSFSALKNLKDSKVGQSIGSSVTSGLKSGIKNTLYDQHKDPYSGENKYTSKLGKYFRNK